MTIEVLLCILLIILLLLCTLGIMKALTAKQDTVLCFLDAFSQSHGFPPTLREIGDAIGLANINAVRGHVAALAKKGYITKSDDKARTIQIVHTPSSFSRLKEGIHKILGTDKGVFHRVVYGLAWKTWQRKQYLGGPEAERMSEAIEREAVERGWTIIEKRIEPDHIVVVVETWPNHSPETVVRRFRDASHAVIAHPSSLQGGKLWSRGYAATTDLEILDELVARLLSDKRVNNS